VSNFRIICVGALTASLFIFLADAAPAQNTPADASGKPYLAGLRPPHERPKVAAHSKTNQVTNTATKSANKTATKSANKTATKTANKTAHKATAKNTQPAITRAPAVASSTRAHARTKLTSSRLTWPQVDPAVAEDRRMPETALQFIGDDVSSNVAAPTSPRVTATKAPPKTVTEERTIVAPADQPAAGDQPPPTSKIVQVEHFQTPPQDVARVEAPPQTQTLAAASVVEDGQPKADHKRAFGSAIAPTLAMLAGAISAALVGCWLFGFGSSRGIKLGP
jgi:hypothetical protein